MDVPETDVIDQVETFTRQAWLLPAYQEKVAGFNKRAAKLGLSQTAHLDVVREFSEAEEIEGLPKALWPTVDFVELRVTGDVIVLPGGWVFVAALDHASEAGNVVRRAPGAEDITVPDAYFTAGPACDHCGFDRQRKDTYIVRSEAGEWKQIGSSCVKDFLGVDPAALAFWTIGFSALSDNDDNVGGGPSYDAGWPTTLFTAVVAAVIRQEGWISRGASRNSYDGKRATADIAGDYFGYKVPKEVRDYLTPVTADIEAAEKALAWIREQAPRITPDQDYLWNLKVAASAEFVTTRNTGILASLVPAWLRAQEQAIKSGLRQSARAALRESSSFQGEVGKRQNFDLVVTFTRVFPSQGGYGYDSPDRLLVKFLDQAGNEYTTWTSVSTEAGLAFGNRSEGTRWIVKATVKAHETYEGVEGTVLTRIKLVEAVGKPAAACTAEVACFETAEWVSSKGAGKGRKVVRACRRHFFDIKGWEADGWTVEHIAKDRSENG